MSTYAEAHFWHQETRLHGFARCKHDWILWIDADEVLREPKLFLEWFDTVKDSKYESFKLANYWYFMSERRRAKQLEDSIVLCRRRVLSFTKFRMQNGEREHFYDHVQPEVKQRGVTYKDTVFFDHFSWVRSKELMLKKVQSWGHRGQRDWKPLVERAFAEDALTTKDFVHPDGFEYEVLP